MLITVSTNFPDVQRALDRLHESLRAPVLASAVNKTLDQARTQMTREITAEFNVKAAYVRDRLRIRRASRKAGAYGIEGSLIGGKAGAGRSANIIAFVEGSTSLAEAKRRAKAGTLSQVFVRVKKSGGKKPLAGAFIGNKGRTVFERVGPGRVPIRPVQVIDVAQMFNTRRINAKVLDVMLRNFPTNFARDARYFTARFNGQG